MVTSSSSVPSPPSPSGTDMGDMTAVFCVESSLVAEQFFSLASWRGGTPTTDELRVPSDASLMVRSDFLFLASGVTFTEDEDEVAGGGDEDEDVPFSG